VTDPAPEATALRTARVRLLGAAILVAFAFALAFDLPRTLPLQDDFFDALQRVHPRADDTTPVTIVQIDEKSLAELGRWPWPRTSLAQLVHTINAYGPSAIGIDIVMPEPDPLSPERVLAHVDVDLALLQQISALPSNDAELATAFRVAPVVVVLAGAPGESAEPMQAPPVFVRDANGQADAAERAIASLIKFPGALSSLATLNAAASGWGLISVEDSHGIVRRVPLIANVNGTIAPAFGVEMWRVASHAHELRVTTANGAILGVRVGDRAFATDGNGVVRPYFSRRNADRSVSAVDVLKGSVAPELLHRSFVLIGVTALALGDNVWTPVGERMPGVELHAQMIENMNGQAFLTRPAYGPAVEAGLLLVFGALLIATTPRSPVRYAAVIAVSCATVLVALAYAAFRADGMLFDAATPALALLLLFGTLLAMTLADATRYRKALQQVVQRQREESARVAGEMQAAQRIQLDTLPRPESVHDARVELAASMEPALEVGGDLYDFYMLDESRLFFMLGDVSGKGLPASIFMAVSKALCKSTMLRAHDADLGALLVQTNVEVSRDNPAALFVTVFAGVLDLRTGALDYCNAGHENPWLVRADRSGTVRLSAGDGPPLCVVDDFPYRAARVELAPGDVVCVVSDGVTEANDSAHALYGTARIERILAKAESACGVVDALREDVKAFAAGATQSDDVTVLGVRWRGGTG
jgi:serine phosphatase RsbU (regulator of sigma subunit)/CHASE2 domain-containing sensor protein